MITTENGYELSNRIKYKPYNTSMDYLQKIINSVNFRQARESKIILTPFMDLVKKPDMVLNQGYYYSQKEKVVNIVREYKEEIRKLYIDYDGKGKDEKKYIQEENGRIKQECIEAIEKMTESQGTMYLTLKELDNKENRDVYRFMFEVFFGKPNQSFFNLINNSKEDMYEVVEVSKDRGNIKLYDYDFIKTKVIKCDNNEIEELDNIV